MSMNGRYWAANRNGTYSRAARILQLLLAALAVSSSASLSYADSVTVIGSITQSPADASQTAINNPSLNNIFDFQAFSVTLDFTGSILAPGTYNSLIGATLIFADGSSGAIETAFDTIFLTITANGGFDDFSLLGCLTTGHSLRRRIILRR